MSYELIEKIASNQFFQNQTKIFVWNQSEWFKKAPPHLQNWGQPEEFTPEIHQWIAQDPLPFCFILNQNENIIAKITPENYESINTQWRLMNNFNWNWMTSPPQH